MEGWYPEINPVLVETGGRIVFGREQWLVPWDCLALSTEIAKLGDPKMAVDGVEIGWNDLLRPSFLLPVACMSISRASPQASLFALVPDPYCLMGFRVCGFRFWGTSFETTVASLATGLRREGGTVDWRHEVDAFGEWLTDHGLDIQVECRVSDDSGHDLTSAAADAVEEILGLNSVERRFRERVVMAIGSRGFDRRTASLASAACVAYSSAGRIDRLAAALFLGDEEFMEARVRHLFGRAQTDAIRCLPGAADTLTVMREAHAVGSDADELRHELRALSSAFRGRPNRRPHLRLVKG